MDYKKPQSTLVQGNTGIYPLTTADQVILADGSRLEKDGKISADSAANSAKLGGKAPEYYIQPRNLLDNSDFRNPVNQRGSSEYMFNFGYSLDRWRLSGGDRMSRVRVLSGYIEVSLHDNKSYFDQLIDIDNTKTYTFAVLIDDGLHVISGIPSVGANDGVILLGINSDGYVRASVVGFLRAYNIYWAALYEGSYTVDTLPPYVPKGYAAELAECRLYYRPQQMYCLYCYSGGYVTGINFEPMRPGVIPTPVNAKAQTMIGDVVAGETNIVVTQIDRVSYAANTNFTYGNYYRVFSEFSSDL